MNEVVALCALVFLAFLVEAAAGFGSTVVALTLGALMFSLDELLAWLLPVNMVLSAYLVASGWKHVDWRFVFVRVMPSMGAGLLIGMAFAARASQAEWLKVVFGVFVMVMAVWQLRTPRTAKALSTPVRVGALFGAGVIHGVFATGGPLAVFVSSRELPDKATFRATLSLLWLLLNGLVLPRLILEGTLNAGSLRTSGLLVIPLVLGIGAGEWLHRRLDEARFHKAVSVLLIIAGAVLTAKSLN
jgi:uncharacterized membrane protein YfcA